ncbi:MAG: FecR family protein [Dysgonomonas sp.]|nr:FecR family protein [Dysgonomonas sp.]
MIINEKNKKETDEAWLHLYNRLEEDGLLTNTKKTPIFGRKAFRWAAAIAVICILSVFTITRYISKESSLPLLTLQNSDMQQTLVTTLNDGSIVYLNGATRLSYPEYFDKAKREVYLQGDAFFDIQRNPEKPFIIETQLVQVEVLGTSFNLRSKDDSSFSLSVLQGEVRVTLKATGETKKIRAGETAISDKNSLLKMQTTNAGLFSDYKKTIRFKDEPLRSIVKVLNLHSDSLQLEIEPALENKLLTFTFTGEDIPTSAQLICAALGLHYEETNNIIRILK